MKKLFILMAVFLLAIPFIAAEDCDTLSDLAEDNLNARYKYYYYRAEIRAVSMDAVIDLYQENEIDTTELEQIKADFIALYEVAEEAADYGETAEFNDYVQDGIDLIASFKERARAESVDGVLAAISSALADKESYLNDLREEAVDAKKEVYLKVFDARVCHHQKIIDRWRERGVDVDDLVLDMNAIEAKRDPLVEKIEEADASCDVPFIICTTSEADELTEYHREINNDFRELNIKFKDFIVKGLVQAAIDLQKTNLDWQRLRLNALEIKGIDITSLEAIYNDAKLLNKEAQAALDNDDIDAAKDKFNEAKTEITNLKQGILEALQ